MDGKWAVFDEVTNYSLLPLDEYVQLTSHERRQRQKMARLERPTDPKPTRSGKTLFDEIVKDNPSKVSFSSDLTREVAQVSRAMLLFHIQVNFRVKERSNMLI